MHICVITMCKHPIYLFLVVVVCDTHNVYADEARGSGFRLYDRGSQLYVNRRVLSVMLFFHPTLPGSFDEFE